MDVKEERVIWQGYSTPVCHLNKILKDVQNFSNWRGATDISGRGYMPKSTE